VNEASTPRSTEEPRTVREIVMAASASSSRTQKQINREYRRHMAEAGHEGPKSIMTKVRDRRRVLALSPTEARCLALALDIEPSLLTPSIDVERDTSLDDGPSSGSARPPEGDAREDAPAQSEPTPSPPPGEDTAAEPLLAERTYGAAGVGFSEVPEGLRFTIDMDLNASQFDRLTLAIPAYMMRIERGGGRIRCRASVPIFPYQAELIMRAIYGGR